MGTLKPLVQVGGTTMLERVLATLRQSRVDEIVVVLGHSAQLIQERIAFGAAKSVINNSYLEGMASSIQNGLASIRPDAEGALIVLADQPFLKPQTIDLLIQEYRRSKREIIIPTYNGFRGNPVLLDRSLFGELATLTGDMGCRALFGKHANAIVTLPVEDAGILVDLDTAEDVQRLEQSKAEGALQSPLFQNADLSRRAT
jgi:molybdenum cofactor cytidylyltransferase